jgi:hypothetical protein
LLDISIEWNSVKTSTHSLEEYYVRYDKMLDMFGDLQKQTKNRRRTAGVVEELTTSYRQACQNVDQEYLRLYSIGSKFYPELLLELKEMCDDVDLISFGRHFGSYEDQQLLYSAKHRVYQAKYEGNPCVLKEFRLDESKIFLNFSRGLELSPS